MNFYVFLYSVWSIFMPLSLDYFLYLFSSYFLVRLFANTLEWHMRLKSVPQIYNIQQNSQVSGLDHLQHFITLLLLLQMCLQGFIVGYLSFGITFNMSFRVTLYQNLFWNYQLWSSDVLLNEVSISSLSFKIFTINNLLYLFIDLLKLLLYHFDFSLLFFQNHPNYKISLPQKRQLNLHDFIRQFQEQMKKQDQTFKMIIIGPPGVGKSCLLNRFTKDVYKQGYTATLGVEFYSKVVSIDQDTQIKMQIWDTAGQESFRSIIKTFYRSSAAVFLVYNIANESSFEELQFWYAEAIENCNPDAVFALIGAQKDRQLERKVSIEKAQKFMKDKDLAFFFQTSSKTSQNVEIAFREAAKQIIFKKISQQIQNKKLKTSGADQPRKKCEC